ncbi:acetate/propionate family kinase [Novosphingobium sp. G106]|uniref:acetate/propionate family kinase n=1 Tax=Novosphingobium sp. G106 TaxID=2849500 RepID=UPI001C2CDAE2|nr:acetate/propionate family kinase [Novosphingobium sp. G106]MBV1690412.1 acetate/propionate family kinase [Novosphingobium sp. G106]
MIVLTLNGGSSSLKFGLYRVSGSRLDPIMIGEADKDGVRTRNKRGEPMRAMYVDGTPETSIPAIAGLISDEALPAPQAIGHRIVHGGPNLRSHCRIDDAVLRELEQIRSLSPLHAPAALTIIALAQAEWPNVPNVACFDTVFHAAMPEVACTLPIPRAWKEQGIRRYGFHGLSCESIVRQLGPNLRPRTIIAHLGSGASVTAVLEGLSIDTSMGLTPSGGIIMGTRTGDIDPGTLIYLAREKGYDLAALEQHIENRSGLLGISALSSDMRVLEGAKGNASAQLAVEMFCLSAAKQVAAMSVALGGIDDIIFTGGIGENDFAVRAAICGHLSWAGVHIDVAANQGSRQRLDDEESPVRVHRFSSKENEEIARHVGELA